MSPSGCTGVVNNAAGPLAGDQASLTMPRSDGPPAPGSVAGDGSDAAHLWLSRRGMGWVFWGVNGCAECEKRCPD